MALGTTPATTGEPGPIGTTPPGASLGAGAGLAAGGGIPGTMPGTTIGGIPGTTGMVGTATDGSHGGLPIFGTLPHPE